MFWPYVVASSCRHEAQLTVMPQMSPTKSPGTCQLCWIRSGGQFVWRKASVRTRDEKRCCHTILLFRSVSFRFSSRQLLAFISVLCPFHRVLFDRLPLSLLSHSEGGGWVEAWSHCCHSCAFVSRLPLSHCSHDLLNLYSQLGLHNLWNKRAAFRDCVDSSN